MIAVLHSDDISEQREGVRRRVAPAETHVAMKLLPVYCPTCGKKYTRALPGSGVEVSCRHCKEVSIVMVTAA